VTETWPRADRRIAAGRTPAFATVATVLRVARLYWLQDPAGTLFTAFHAVVLPMLVFYFGVRIARGHPETLLRMLAGGIAIGTGIGAATKVGFAILADVQLGRLALIRSIGIAKSGYFGAHIASALAFGLLSTGACLLVLINFDLLTVKPWQIGPFVLVALASGGAMGALGALIAVTAPDHATGHARLSLASAGLAFVSPVFYPTAMLPLPLAVLSWASPFTHAAELNRARRTPRRGSAAVCRDERHRISVTAMAMNCGRLQPFLGLLRLRLLGLHRSIASHLVYGAVMPWLFLATLGEFAPREDALRLAAAAGILSACFMALRAPAAAFVGERLRGVQALLTGTGGVTSRTYLAVHFLGVVALSTLSFAVLVGAALRSGVAAPHSAGWVVPMVLVVLCLHGLGMWLARSGISLGALLLVVDLTIAALIVLCPLFYAADAVPMLLRPLVSYAPPTLGVQATLAWWQGDAGAFTPTALLAAWAAALMTLGYRGVRVG
jgi:ABC-2 type transport system permease protein